MGWGGGRGGGRNTSKWPKRRSVYLSCQQQSEELIGVDVPLCHVTYNIPDFPSSSLREMEGFTSFKQPSETCGERRGYR